MLVKGQRRLPEDKVSADEEIRNPFLLEFLGLKDEYSESDLEEALILHLEKFLLELGNDFAFVGRQKRSADRPRMVSRGLAVFPSAAALPRHH